MSSVLERSFSFGFIIFMGYFLKRRGIFRKEDFRVLSLVLMRFTLPCSIIYNFSSMKLNLSLFLLCVIGLGINLVTLAVGFLLNLGKNSQAKSFDMVNLSGFNIGAFALPFAQSFLGPMGVVAASLFDTGNSIMCTGLTYTIAQMVQDSGAVKKQIDLRKMGKALFSSVPFDTYIIMVIVAARHITLPSLVVQCASVGASANACIAMLMIGVGAEFAVQRDKLGHLLRILSLRFAIGIGCAVVLYQLPMFAEEVRKALVIVCLAPISVVAPAFTERLGGDIELASTVNAVSILVSVTLIVSVLVVLV